MVLTNGSKSPHQVVRHINLTINERYVSDWGSWEGLREIYQNFKDAIIMKTERLGIPSASMGLVINTDDETSFEADFIVTDFKNSHYQDPPFGKIKYENNEITLINDGAMSTKCLLLGGTKVSEAGDQSEVAGRFGEGMKLAALALVREAKQESRPARFRIGTGKQQWKFDLEQDSRFEENCLFVDLDDRPEEEMKMYGEDTTSVTLHIDQAFWKDKVRFRFLDMKNDDVHIVKFTYGKNWNRGGSPMIGQLILNEAYQGNLWSKGLWIAEMKNSLPFYGYDIFDVELNRDRKSANNTSQCQDLAMRMVAYMLENPEEVLKNSDSQRIKEAVEKASETIFNYLHKHRSGSDWQKVLASHLTRKTATKWLDLFKSEHKGKLPWNGYTHKKQSERKEYEDEYENIGDTHLYAVLKKAAGFQSLHDKIDVALKREMSARQSLEAKMKKGKNEVKAMQVAYTQTQLDKLYQVEAALSSIMQASKHEDHKFPYVMVLKEWPKDSKELEPLVVNKRTRGSKAFCVSTTFFDKDIPYIIERCMKIVRDSWDPADLLRYSAAMHHSLIGPAGFPQGGTFERVQLQHLARDDREVNLGRRMQDAMRYTMQNQMNAFFSTYMTDRNLLYSLQEKLLGRRVHSDVAEATKAIAKALTTSNDSEIGQVKREVDDSEDHRGVKRVRE